MIFDITIAICKCKELVFNSNILLQKTHPYKEIRMGKVQITLIDKNRTINFVKKKGYLTRRIIMVVVYPNSPAFI